MEQPWRRRAARAVLALLGLLVVTAVGGGLWLRWELGKSLPALDGEPAVAGLVAPVRIERDALGVARIIGANRLDLARATGFLHAQDRFFQMDLLRRRAAGELAEILGPALVKTDRDVRVHRFRAVARRVVEGSSAEERAFVQAYADGVNAGLAALGARPFEYLALRARPQPWRPSRGTHGERRLGSLPGRMRGVGCGRKVTRGGHYAPVHRLPRGGPGLR